MKEEERTILVKQLEFLTELHCRGTVLSEVVIKKQEVIVERLLESVGDIPVIPPPHKTQPDAREQPAESLRSSGTSMAKRTPDGPVRRRALYVKLGVAVPTIVIIALLLIRVRQFYNEGSNARVPETEHVSAASLSRYVRNKHLSRVIVFVHGIYGSAQSTWSCASSKVSWPDMLVLDKTFRDADIYVASYSSSSQMSIDDVVGNMNNRFEHDRVFTGHREVIFVCHSLGGLVIQRMLLHHHEYAAQVPFIYFFATPQTGSQMAKVGHFFVNSSLMEAMFPGDHNIYLANLRDEWRDARFGIRRYCAVERAGVKGAVVVRELSGEWNCDQVVAIPDNHIDIVKPCKADDDAYIALQNAIAKHPVARATSTTRK